MNNYEKWLSLKEQIKLLTEELHAAEADIWIENEALGNINPSGSKTSHIGEFSVTITHGDSYKINQKIAAERPELFRVKYEFDKTQYKNLVSSQKQFVDDVLTITPMKPSFKVVRTESELP